MKKKVSDCFRAAKRARVLCSHVHTSTGAVLGSTYTFNTTSNQRTLTTTSATTRGTVSNLREVGFVEALSKTVACGVVTVPWVTTGTIVSLFSRSLGHRIMSNWGAACLRIFGIDVEVEERDFGDRFDTNKQKRVDRFERREGKALPLLLACLNQCSHVESWIIHALPLQLSASSNARAMLGPHFVFANIEYLLIPFLGWYVWLQGAVVVFREWKEQARGALDKAIDKVTKGEACYMSIEGRRSEDGTLSPYKRGCAIMAITTQAYIVPMVLLGTYDILPFGSWRVNSGKVKAVIGKPISTQGLSLEDRFMVTQKLRDIAESILHEHAARS